MNIFYNISLYRKLILLCVVLLFVIFIKNNLLFKCVQMFLLYFFKLRIVVLNLCFEKNYILKFGQFLFWKLYNFLGSIIFYKRLHLWFEWLIYRYGLYHTNYLYLVLRFVTFLCFCLISLYVFNFFILEINEYVVSKIGVLISSYVLFVMLIIYMLLFSFMLRSFLLEFYSIILCFSVFFIALLYLGDFYYWEFNERDVFAELEDYWVYRYPQRNGRWMKKALTVGPEVQYKMNRGYFDYFSRRKKLSSNLAKNYRVSRRYNKLLFLFEKHYQNWPITKKRQHKLILKLVKRRVNMKWSIKKWFFYQFTKNGLLNWYPKFSSRTTKSYLGIHGIRYFFYDFLVFFGFDDYDPFSVKLRFGLIDNRHYEEALAHHENIYDDGDYWEIHRYVYGIDEREENYPEVYIDEDESYASNLPAKYYKTIGSLFSSDNYMLEYFKRKKGTRIFGRWARSLNMIQVGDVMFDHVRKAIEKDPKWQLRNKKFMKLRLTRLKRHFLTFRMPVAELGWVMWMLNPNVATTYGNNSIYANNVEYYDLMLRNCLSPTKIVEFDFDLSKMSYNDARRVIRFNSDLEFIYDQQFGFKKKGGWNFTEELNVSEKYTYPGEMIFDKYEYLAEKRRIRKTLWKKTRKFAIYVRNTLNPYHRIKYFRFRVKHHIVVRLGRRAFGVTRVYDEPFKFGNILTEGMLGRKMYKRANIPFMFKQYAKSITYLNLNARIASYMHIGYNYPRKYGWFRTYWSSGGRVNYRVAHNWFLHYSATTDNVDFKPDFVYQEYSNYAQLRFLDLRARFDLSPEDLTDRMTIDVEIPWFITRRMKINKNVPRFWLLDAVFNHFNDYPIREFYGAYPDNLFNVASIYNVHKPSALLFGNTYGPREAYIDTYTEDLFLVNEDGPKESMMLADGGIDEGGVSGLGSVPYLVLDYFNLFINPIEEEYMIGVSIVWMIVYFTFMWYIWVYMFSKIKNPLKIKLMKSNLLGLVPYLNIPINNVYMSELYDVRLFLRRLNWIIRNQPWKVEMFTKVMYADMLYINEDYQDFSITGLDILTSDIEKLDGSDVIQTPIRSMDDKFNEFSFDDFGFKKFSWDFEWLQDVHDELDLEDDEEVEEGVVDVHEENDEEPNESDFGIYELMAIFGSPEHDDMLDYGSEWGLEETEEIALSDQYSLHNQKGAMPEEYFLDGYNFFGGDSLVGMRNKLGYYNESGYEDFEIGVTNDNELELEKMNEEAILNYYYHRYKLFLVRSYFFMHPEKKVGSNYKYYFNLYLYNEKKKNSLVFTNLYKDFENDLLWFFPMFFDEREVELWFSSENIMEGVELSNESSFSFDDDVGDIDGGDWTYNVEIERLLLKEWSTSLGLSVNNYLVWKQNFSIYLNEFKYISILESWKLECNKSLSNIPKFEGFKICSAIAFLKMEYYVNTHLGIFFVVYNKTNLFNAGVEDRILYKREVLVNNNVTNYIKNCDYDFVFENYVENWGDYWFLGLNEVYIKAIQNIYRLHYFSLNGTLYDLYSLSSSMFYDSFTGEMFLWFPFADVLGIITHNEIAFRDNYGLNAVELFEMEPKYIYSSYDFYKNKVRDYYKVLSSFIANRVGFNKNENSEDLVDVLLEGYSANKLLGSNYNDVKHITQILISIHWRYYLESLKVQPLWDRLNQNVIYGDLRRGEFFPGYLSDVDYTKVFWRPFQTKLSNSKFLNLRNYNLIKSRRNNDLKYFVKNEFYEILNRKEFGFLLGDGSNKNDLFLYDLSKLGGANNLVKVVDNILAFFVLEEEVEFCKLMELFSLNSQYGKLLFTDMFFSVVKEQNFDSLVKICCGLVLENSEILILEEYLSKFRIKFVINQIISTNFNEMWIMFENYKHKLNNVFFFSVITELTCEFKKLDNIGSYFDFAGADVRYRLPYKVSESMLSKEINNSDYDMFEYLSSSKLHVIPILDFYFDQRFSETGFLKAEVNNYVLYEPLSFDSMHEDDFLDEADYDDFEDDLIDDEDTENEWEEVGNVATEHSDEDS